MKKVQIFDHKSIEEKWSKKWVEDRLYRSIDYAKSKTKFYVLVEFPYPSGAGLHIGHGRPWSAMDAYSRKKRMEGLNIMFPMGWDAFGLPAENYAIKMGIHPSKTVSDNIARFKEQCISLGFSFDWDREVDTTDPKYYKWTQWIFVQLFKRGLAYRVEVPVNWCPFCKTNLADEEVLPNGTHERCGKATERRMQKQWLLRITKYADRLLDDLKLVDYSEKIAQQQINWIGKKEWIDITYLIEATKETIVVSTTRPDTNFGATFIVIAPEHPLLAKEKNLITKKYQKDVYGYINMSLKKSELERISQGREKTGVDTGLKAINQLNGKKMPIWVADFALMNVGTGAVVGVPGHDIRDFEFAKKFSLPVVRVVVGEDGDTSPINQIEQVQEDEGTMVNSEFLDGLNIHEATKKIMDYLEAKHWGKRVMRYHLHDWIFSRQHYWGEPIPMIYCEACARSGKGWFDTEEANSKKDWDPVGWYPVPEKELPLELPYLEKYQPSGTGESPLANVKEWLMTSCPACGKPARREADTMPNWAGSNWYYIRYIDNKNDQEIASQEKMKYWLPVDIYEGGFEHTTLHLLYSRFIYKFLYDIGVVPNPEPYAKRRSHGIVLASDSRKMSKSFGNTVNPDDIISKYGADALRLYEMFMGPFDQAISWSEESLEGCYRFLMRVWRMFNNNVGTQPSSRSLTTKLHQTIKKVDSDIEELKFNTAIAAIMELVNLWSKEGKMSKSNAATFIKILAPFAPFLSEEIWVNILKKKYSIHLNSWPSYNSKLLKVDKITVIVQIDGKVRSQLTVSSILSTNKGELEKIAQSDSVTAKWLKGKKVIKVVFVPERLINFVTK